MQAEAQKQITSHHTFQILGLIQYGLYSLRQLSSGRPLENICRKLRLQPHGSHMPINFPFCRLPKDSLAAEA